MTDRKSSADNDMLASIFRMQAELNDYVFSRNGLAASSGAALSMAAIEEEAAAGRLGVNALPNTWLSRYSRAMREELDELDADLLWKWWSRDDIDLQNIRVELIDLLHFLVSAMICAGLDADRVFDIYSQKHAVNIRRQDKGYNLAGKSEDDNRGIS